MFKTKPVLQEQRCQHCDVVIQTVTKYGAGASLITRNKSCKSCFIAALAKAKAGQLNPNWKGGPESPTGQEKQRRATRDWRADARLRMLTNNPMKQPEAQEKMRATKRHLLTTGALVYKKGATHHLWKGNRKASFVLRTRVKPWTRAVLEKDRFCCTHCGKRGGRLEVHHVNVTFAQIVETCLERVGLTSLAGIDVSSTLFEQIAQAVIQEHHIDNGRTLCHLCHSEFDAQRRPPKEVTP